MGGAAPARPVGAVARAVTILLDTSVLIDHLRGNPRARSRLEDAARTGELLAISVLTRTELLAGMRSSEEPSTRRLLSVLEHVPVDERIAERAGALAREFLRSYPGIHTVDYIIAATVEQLDALLWTRDVRHFPMIEGLAAPY